MVKFMPQWNIENGTIKAVMFMIGLLSVLIGLGSLGVVKYFKFNAPQFYGFFLLLGAVVLFTEEKLWELSEWTAPKLVTSIVMTFGFGLGFWQIAGKALNSTMIGIAGVVYIILGIMVIRALFT